MTIKGSKLGPQTRLILDTLAERVIPSGGPQYPGAGDVLLPEKIIDFLSGMPGALQGFAVALWLWEFSPFINSLYFKRFTSMTPEQQTSYMEAWEQSRFFARRMAFLGLKGIFMAVFYDDPGIWEKIGYKEECLVPRDGGQN